MYKNILSFWLLIFAFKGAVAQTATARLTPPLPFHATVNSGVVTKKMPVRADVHFPIISRLKTLPSDKTVSGFYEINGKKGIIAQEGDTPGKLAARADVWLSNFLIFNDMNVQDRLVAGEVYYLEKKNRKAVIPFYTTQRNETLRQVAHMFGIRLESLLKYNRLDAVEPLQPGRVLWIQKRRPASQAVEVIPPLEAPANEASPVQSTADPLAESR